MKKTIATIFIISLLLGACSNADATPTSEVEATKAATKTPKAESTPEAQSQLGVKEEALNGIEISVWTPWYGVESSLFNSLISKFNAENPWGIIVAGEEQVNYGNLYESVNAALPTTKRPDVVIALPEHAREWNSQQVVTNLAPYVEDPQFGMDTSDIPEVFWEQDANGAGRVAIPAQRTAQFLLWNKTWAGELGFDSAPDTPEDFRQQSCRGQQAMRKDESAQNDFMGGWLVDTEPMTAYAWMLAFDGGALEGNDYRFLTPNNIDAFKFLREAAEQTCTWQAAGADSVSAFANREALFVTASLEDLPDVSRAFASAGSKDQWMVIPFPGVTKDVMVVYGSSYVVLTSNSEEQLASWLFIRWLLESEQDARMVEATHLFPLRASSLDLLAAYEKSHPQWKQAVDLLPNAVMQPQLASWRTVKTMIGDGFAHMYRINMPSGQVAAILAQMEAISRELK